MTKQPQQDDPAKFPDETPDGRIPVPSQDPDEGEESSNGTD